MKKVPSIVSLILASVAGAWSADSIVDGAPSFYVAPTSPGRVKALYY